MIEQTEQFPAAREQAGDRADMEGFIWGVSFNPFAYLDAIDFDTPVRPDRRAALWRRLGELQ